MQKQINGFQGARSPREETYCNGAQGTFWDNWDFFSPDGGGSYEIDTFFKTHQLPAKGSGFYHMWFIPQIKLLIKKRNVFKFFLSMDPGGCPWCIVNRRKARFLVVWVIWSPLVKQHWKEILYIPLYVYWCLQVHGGSFGRRVHTRLEYIMRVGIEREKRRDC